MIRKDELAPSARRRRLYDVYATYSDNLWKSTVPVGKGRFHSRDSYSLTPSRLHICYSLDRQRVWAPTPCDCYIHAPRCDQRKLECKPIEPRGRCYRLIDGLQILQTHSYHLTPGSLVDRIPVTLKHFKMLARLGKQPVRILFNNLCNM